MPAGGAGGMAAVPDTVPMLPDCFSPDTKLQQQLIQMLVGGDGGGDWSSGSDPAAQQPAAQADGDDAPAAGALGWICATGMGGLGKTTMAAAVARDPGIRRHFDRQAFVSVGQTPSIVGLQQAMYYQLTGASPSSLLARGDLVISLFGESCVCIPEGSLFVLFLPAVLLVTVLVHCRAGLEY